MTCSRADSGVVAQGGRRQHSQRGGMEAASKTHEAAVLWTGAPQVFRALVMPEPDLRGADCMQARPRAHLRHFTSFAAVASVVQACCCRWRRRTGLDSLLRPVYVCLLACEPYAVSAWVTVVPCRMAQVDAPSYFEPWLRGTEQSSRPCSCVVGTRTP